MSTGIDGKSEQELFARHEQLKAEKPWLKDQHYFKNCRMTRLALMKIWCHAHEGALNLEDGAPREIIGILLGYVADEMVIVTDVIESPDFGTGHSVQISVPGGDHVEKFLLHNLNMGITATKVGMYHSHPKLGVFLSGVDVQQNRRGQLFGDEHVSIVIDSVESVETGRLEIGAFRSYSVQDAKLCPNPPPAPKEEANESFAVDPLEEVDGNGLGLGGIKLYRHGHQKSASDRPNPHVEGLAFFKDQSKGGGYYRMKMSICHSSCEADVSMQMLPESWMTPLLGSPLLDSVPLSVHSTEMSAEVAKKAAASGRGIFDHSNSLIGSESEMTRACAHCSPLIAFQERCVLVDQTKAVLFQKPE